ncbi:hypothetical protein [Microbacterium sp. BH-3-3-3]|nr:hypothetical protein [Microbacterium sp. BH-3-3-3]
MSRSALGAAPPSRIGAQHVAKIPPPHGQGAAAGGRRDAEPKDIPTA